MYRSICALVPALALLALVGCTNEEPANEGVTATEVRASALATAIQQQKGKVVLIDCWATWCPPCVKKFPHHVELHEKYGEKGLVCMSLNMDKYGDADLYSKKKVVKFLKNVGATFPNFIVSEPKLDEEPLLKLLGDFSAIPHVVMFDRSGRKVWASNEGPRLDDEQLEKRIEEELAAKP